MSHCSTNKTYFEILAPGISPNDANTPLPRLTFVTPMFVAEALPMSHSDHVNIVESES
jgi:hypothetical protein